MSSPGIGQINEVIHGRIRLGIMTYLANSEVADFTELANALEATRGNLSIHLRKLEDAGYVSIEKSFLDRKPLTQVRLTPDGGKAFKAYVKALSDLLGSAGS